MHTTTNGAPIRSYQIHNPNALRRTTDLTYGDNTRLARINKALASNEWRNAYQDDTSVLERLRYNGWAAPEEINIRRDVTRHMRTTDPTLTTVTALDLYGKTLKKKRSNLKKTEQTNYIVP
jgi:hypothetical protein